MLGIWCSRYFRLLTQTLGAKHPTRAVNPTRICTALGCESGGNGHSMVQVRKPGVCLTQWATAQAAIEQLDALLSQTKSEAAGIQ